MADIKKLATYIASENIAEMLDEKELVEIGITAKEGYDIDKRSRQPWEEKMTESLKIAKQILEHKSTPFDGASNVKFPLLLSACLQFNSRMYPEIIKDNKVAKTTLFAKPPLEPNLPTPQNEQEKEKAELIMQGYDQAQGAYKQLQNTASSISDHISFQLLENVDNWEGDVDKMLMVLPLYGHAFKKVWYDPINKKPQITFCLPEDIVVNQNIQSLKTAPRISHILRVYKNFIWEQMARGAYLKEDVKDLVENEATPNLPFEAFKQSEAPQGSSDDEENPLITLVEQHTYLDLDDDGYKEPYIVTFQLTDGKVLRIKANYGPKNLVVNDENEIISIKPIEYFIDYHFLRPADGTYYGIGFGQLLYPLNEAVNSLINQLVDAGSLSNTNSGFVDERLRWRKGDYSFLMGEFKQVTVPIGSTLAQSILPLPVRPPSNVLFQLLGMLIQTAREISNVSDISQGQQSAQNVPATTVLALIEQGQKIYSVIQKRIYLSIKKELGLLGKMNKEHMNDKEYFAEAVGMGLVKPEYYEQDNISIYPVADPVMSSQTMRLAQAQALLQFAQDPDVSSYNIKKRYFESLGIADIPEILPEPSPNPEPSAQEKKLMAETAFIEVQKADLLTSIDEKGISLAQKDRQIAINASQVGAQMAQMRQNSELAYMNFALELHKSMMEDGHKNADREYELFAEFSKLASAQQSKTDVEGVAEIKPLKEAIAEKVGTPDLGASTPNVPPSNSGNSEAPSPNEAAIQKDGSPPESAPSLPEELDPMREEHGIMEGREKPSPQQTEKLIASNKI